MALKIGVLSHAKVWTMGLTLSRAVTDHEGQELGLAPPGAPGMIPAGTFWDPNQYFCNISGK
jgi:hypothetical protein